MTRSLFQANAVNVASGRDVSNLTNYPKKERKKKTNDGNFMEKFYSV